MEKETFNLRNIMKEVDDIIEASDKYKLRFTEYQYLWKTDNEDWMQHRKEEWKTLRNTICKDCSAKELKNFSKFYLSGEEITPDDRSMSFTVRFIFTPFSTSEEAHSLYQLIGHPSSMEMVASGFMSYCCKHCADMPWLRDKIQCFIDGVLGNEYNVVTKKNGPREIIITPEPTSFCSSYAKGVLGLVTRKQSYHFCVDTVNYFITALPHATYLLTRKRIKIQPMMDEVAKVMKNPADYPELVQELAQQLSARENEIWENWNINKHLDEQQ